MRGDTAWRGRPGRAKRGPETKVGELGRPAPQICNVNNASKQIRGEEPLVWGRIDRFNGTEHYLMLETFELFRKTVWDGISRRRYYAFPCPVCALPTLAFTIQQNTLLLSHRLVQYPQPSSTSP